MNPFQLLKNDHKIVSGLFDQIESASGNSKKQLFTRLKSELDVHALIEEKVFYPALENKKESREITLEAYEEHKVVKDLLSELATAQSADDEWDAKLKVLRENVDHHVEEEEGELFNKAGDVLNDEQLDRLGDEMEAEKARQMGVKPPRSARGGSKAAGPKASGSRKQADKPGVLKRLASFVGLSDGASEGGSKRATPPGKKKAAKGAARKSSSKGTAKKSVAKKASKTGSKATGARKTAAGKKSGSKTAAKKSSRGGGGSKQRKSAKKR